MQRYFKIIIVLLFIAPLISNLSFGDNRILVDKAKNELLDLNDQIVKSIKNKKNFNNRKIFVKVRRTKKEGNFHYIIEEIGSDASVDPKLKNTNNTFIVEGNLKKDKKEKFHFDIEHIFPPEKQENETNNSKRE